MKVGGKSENREKKTVWPAAVLPSIVTLKVLFVLLADFVGVMRTKNCVHSVVVAALACVEAVAKTAPLASTRDAVRLPENFEP